MKKILTLALAAILTISAVVGGTVAYLSSTDSDVNVMTLGNVKIEQHQFERVVNADGSYALTTSARGEGYKLQEYTQAKPLLPAVGSVTGWDSTPIWFDQLSSNAGGGQRMLVGIKGVQDHIVLVENTGRSDAYVRTLFAFEMGSLTVDEWDRYTMTTTNELWGWNWIGAITVENNSFMLCEAIYNGSDVRHVGGILPAGEYTYNSLAQIYMTYEATNEVCEAIDGNQNGAYDILVVSQAVQTTNFEQLGAGAALDAAFGDITADNHPWVDGVEIPTVKQEEGVSYIIGSEVATVNAMGGDTVFRGNVSDGATVSSVIVNEGITRLNNRAFCKSPSLTEVSLPESLTYIDEGVFQQSGFVTIEVPENVTYIGKTAFGACANLETIIIKSQNVTLANYVARDCASLREVYIYSDSVTFESGSMYFTRTQSGDASAITFYVANQEVADALFNSSSASRSYGMLIVSLDGATEYYNTLH